jgi:lipoprotein-anchoring transpeptidase ErfK/SrfK
MMGGSNGGTTDGMMGSGVGAAPAQPAAGPASLARAHVLAQRWLDANEPGTTVERAGDAFPGYYTLETLRGGRMSGMISVNASSGAVWPHWWHGRFLEIAG